MVILSDFRVDHGTVLDELLTDNVAALTVVGVVKLKRAAHDGVRVRASAGAASFRREDKLNEHLTAAREHVQALKQQIETDPGCAQPKAGGGTHPCGTATRRAHSGSIKLHA